MSRMSSAACTLIMAVEDYASWGMLFLLYRLNGMSLSGHSKHL